MARYTTNDGEQIEASSARDLLAKLRRGSHIPGATIEAFKADLVARVEQQTGKLLNPHSDADIVNGLIEIGLLTKHIGD